MPNVSDVTWHIEQCTRNQLQEWLHRMTNVKVAQMWKLIIHGEGAYHGVDGSVEECDTEDEDSNDTGIPSSREG